MQRITKIKPFIDKYNWEGINYLSEKYLIGKNLYVLIEKNILYAKKEKIYPACVSKHNSNLEKQIIILMIPKEGGWHYLAVKKLLVLLRGIMSKHHSDFYCLNYLHSFATENKREPHKKFCENKDFCNVMPSEDTEILEFNQYQKSDKAPFIIYVDLECLIEKIDGCKNNPENSSTTKVNIFHEVSMVTISSFKSINEHDVYKTKDCMKTFCEFLRVYSIEIINLKKKLKSLTKEQKISYQNANICYICNEKN